MRVRGILIFDFESDANFQKGENRKILVIRPSLSQFSQPSLVYCNISALSFPSCTDAKFRFTDRIAKNIFFTVL